MIRSTSISTSYLFVTGNFELDFEDLLEICGACVGVGCAKNGEGVLAARLELLLTMFDRKFPPTNERFPFPLFVGV